MSQTCAILTALAVLAVHLCIGEKSCVIWSSAGSVVRRGSSFNVCCIFNCNCKASMYRDRPDTPQHHTELNTTMICLHVMNITKNRTYSCKCNCHAPDPCGLDISTGYPPDPPENITCIYNVPKDQTGTVTCTWKRGRNTYLSSTSTLRVTSRFGNHTHESRDYDVSTKGSHVCSATFDVSSSVQLISVRVRTQNHLDYADSDSVNYTLSDIAMPSPPVFGGVTCSSRVCNITVKQSVKPQHLKIQYRTEYQPWTMSPESGVQMGFVRSVSSLEPYRLYHFRARAKFSTGLWSGWSANISSWTDEEAPAKELDVWYCEANNQPNSIKVYWKAVNNSVMRGKITEYTITVFNQDTRSGFSINTNTSSYLVPSCAGCEVTVSARNSKGTSPPAKIITRQNKANPPLDMRVKAGKLNVTISWRKPETAPGPRGYVVEWYPQGRKLEELRWVRLDKKDDHTVITDMKPFECYHGAVSVLYNENPVSRTTFTGVSILESAPKFGPYAQDKVDGNKVEVLWTELPRHQRGGCIINYTIYIENKGSGFSQSYHVPASKRSHVITGLSPAMYSLWMTACTAEGESPAGEIIKFFIQQESRASLLIMCAMLCLSLLCVLCACQSSAVKRRFWMVFQCRVLSDVPDPANSKWAKECSSVKGKMDLQIQPSNSGVTEEEEDKSMFVDVEELLEQSGDASTPAAGFSSEPTPQSSLTPETTPLLYPLTSYIKSFSHDSDCSEHTETSLDTNTTVDYISSHGPENRTEDEEDAEGEKDVMKMLDFFPSHSMLMEPWHGPGKLTLEAVKIDCSNFRNT